MRKSTTTSAGAMRFERHAALFYALSNAYRLRTIDRLRGGERSACDLQADLPCARPLLAFHLQALRDAILVTTRRERRWIHYAVAADRVEHQEAALNALRSPRAVLRKLPRNGCR